MIFFNREIVGSEVTRVKQNLLERLFENKLGHEPLSISSRISDSILLKKKKNVSIPPMLSSPLIP